MIEIDEAEITAKGEQYADSKSVYFKPFLSSYTQAIKNAYIDAYIAGLLAHDRRMDAFLNAEEIIKE